MRPLLLFLALAPVVIYMGCNKKDTNPQKHTIQSTAELINAVAGNYTGDSWSASVNASGQPIYSDTLHNSSMLFEKHTDTSISVNGLVLILHSSIHDASFIFYNYDSWAGGAEAIFDTSFTHVKYYSTYPYTNKSNYFSGTK